MTRILKWERNNIYGLIRKEKKRKKKKGRKKVRRFPPSPTTQRRSQESSSSSVFADSCRQPMRVSSVVPTPGRAERWEAPNPWSWERWMGRRMKKKGEEDEEAEVDRYKTLGRKI